MANQPPPLHTRTVQVGDQVLTLLGGGGHWWLELDGRRVPMRLRITESTLGNSGTHDRELQGWRTVDTAPLAALAGGDELQVRQVRGATQVVCTAVTSRAAIYNTVLYHIDRIEVTLTADGSRADVWLDHHTDMSD